MTKEQQEIAQLFVDNFITDLEEYPEHYEIMFGVPIEKIKADPEYYYDLPINGACFNFKTGLDEKLDRMRANLSSKGRESQKTPKDTRGTKKRAVRGSVTQKQGILPRKNNAF